MMFSKPFDTVPHIEIIDMVVRHNVMRRLHLDSMTLKQKELLILG